MLRCVQNPDKTWGFAHVCESCEAVGPIVGSFPVMRDAAEMQTLGIVCPGDGTCLGAKAGFLTGEKDLCPKCRKGA